MELAAADFLGALANWSARRILAGAASPQLLQQVRACLPLALRWAPMDSCPRTAERDICCLLTWQAAEVLETARQLVVQAADAVLQQAAPPESPALQAWRRRLQQFQQLLRSRLRDRKVWERTLQRDLLPQVLAWAAEAETSTAQRGSSQHRSCSCASGGRWRRGPAPTWAAPTCGAPARGGCGGGAAPAAG